MFSLLEIIHRYHTVKIRNKALLRHHTNGYLVGEQVRFFYSFTCRENLYLVMEYLNGGDLFSLLRNLGCLEEDMARIYIAELVRTNLIGLLNFDILPTSLPFSEVVHRSYLSFSGSCIGVSPFFKYHS